LNRPGRKGARKRTKDLTVLEVKDLSEDLTSNNWTPAKVRKGRDLRYSGKKQQKEE